MELLPAQAPPGSAWNWEDYYPRKIEPGGEFFRQRQEWLDFPGKVFQDGEQVQGLRTERSVHQRPAIIEDAHRFSITAWLLRGAKNELHL